MNFTNQLNPSFSPPPDHLSNISNRHVGVYSSSAESNPRKRKLNEEFNHVPETANDRCDSLPRPSAQTSSGLPSMQQPEYSSPAVVCWEAHIPTILRRLAKVEDELALLKTPPKTNNGSEIASMRSILAPALQGSSDLRVEAQYGSQDGTTPIYSEQERQLGSQFLDSLSLRRDLLSPENPPFGTWWTYTVEETLVWPIFDFRGDVNSGLDALLDVPDDDDDGDEEDDGAPISNCSSVGPVHTGGAKRGLDDGDSVHELVESFLENIHTQNPILDPAQLRISANTIVENGLGWDGETCQVLLACALGAVSYPWSSNDLENFSVPNVHPEKRATGREYFKAAQKRLGALWSRSSLLATQCLFMSGIYFMYTLQPVAGWRAFNSATIACRSYISKRVANRNKAVPSTDTRNLEQRLCWSCIKSEREVTCEFGMETSGLNQLAYSSTLPTPPNGFAPEINNISALSPSTQVRPQEDESWYYFLTEIMLRKLQMRIDIFYQDKRREAYRRAGESAETFFRSMAEALQEFDFQLMRYYQNLPPVMQFSLDDLRPCADELRHFLRWRVFCVRHDITLPALYILLHNDVARWDPRLIGELIQLANVCLRLDVEMLRNAITTYRHQTTWLCLRTAVRSALILIAADRLVARRLPGLEGLFVPNRADWEEGLRMLVQRLHYWSRESKDCLAYVEILRQLHVYQ